LSCAASGCSNVDVELEVRAAADAQHVVVRPLVGALELGDAVVEVRMPHYAELFQNFESAVHGRNIDDSGAATNLTSGEGDSGAWRPRHPG